MCPTIRERSSDDVRQDVDQLTKDVASRFDTRGSFASATGSLSPEHASAEGLRNIAYLTRLSDTLYDIYLMAPAKLRPVVTAFDEHAKAEQFFVELAAKARLAKKAQQKEKWRAILHR